MLATFDLIDEPWIPCTMLDGSQRSLGLREVLAQAQDIGELGGDSPLEVAALHRLLLAVLHRNFDIGDEQQWGALWENGAFDSEVINDYFEKWRGRFDLFDEERPFYQVAGLDPTKGGSSARLFFHQDNNATLFTHVATADPPSLTPAESARLLVGFMAFDVGGLKSDGSAKAAMLNNGALVLIKGSNLFQTLMLNLCRYAPQDGAPWDFNPDRDIPAWERDEETRPEDRSPAGYIDLLTWQSRRIRLQPETEQDGSAVVRNVVIMKGAQPPSNFVGIRYRETMLAFRSNKDAKGQQDPWPVVTFREDRALWRDSHALMSSTNAESVQPRTLTWLADLAYEGIIPYSQIVPVDVFGLGSTRAKIEFWRHERLPLPLAYLEREDNQLADTLGVVLELTETAAQNLNRSMWIMATRMLAADPDRKPKAEDVRSLSDHLGAARVYWSQLEAPFKRLLVELPDDKDEEGEYGGVLFGKWKSTLRDALWRAFRESTRGMERSTRNLKAAALAERSLAAITRKHLAAHEAGGPNDAA